jgi:hypothetical protein
VSDRYLPLMGDGAGGASAPALSNTEVFAGFPVAVLRPLVTRRWNRLFQAAVDGLIGQASAARSGSSR